MSAAKEAGTPPSEEKARKVERCTVAAGRSVDHDGKRYGPGGIVTIETGWARELRALGFLTDPAAAVIEPSNGPVFRSQSDVIKAS